MKPIFFSFQRWNNNFLFPWVVLFLLLALAVTQYGGTNAKSRIAALRAMSEGHSLHINNYKDWTIDWSLSPNGNYYSNKAPGAALFGFPVFYVLDIPARLSQADQKDEKGRVPEPGYLQLTLFVLLTQLLPFSILVLLIGESLRSKGISRSGIHFFALAALFGNTAALYMNSYFGHGMAAMFFLAATFFWIEKKYVFAGFFIAATTLTDYGGACTVPFFLLATLWREKSFKPFLPIAIGALPIGAIWIWYHSVAFGNPFAVASQFINPTQVEELPDRPKLLGTMAALPSLEIVFKLLFSSERGILVTQPWVLLIATLLLFTPFRSWPRGLALFLLGGLVGLLWMNGSVGGWHGGFTLGPRYLSLLFPAFALAIAYVWNQLSKVERLALWVLLAIALLYKLLVYPFTNLAPLENLWTYHYQLYFGEKKGTSFLRLAIALLLTSGIYLWFRKREAKSRNS